MVAKHRVFSLPVLETVHNKELDPEDSRHSNMNNLSSYLASDTVLDIVPMSLVSY